LVTKGPSRLNNAISFSIPRLRSLVIETTLARLQTKYRTGSQQSTPQQRLSGRNRRRRRHTICASQRLFAKMKWPWGIGEHSIQNCENVLAHRNTRVPALITTFPFSLIGCVSNFMRARLRAATEKRTRGTAIFCECCPEKIQRRANRAMYYSGLTALCTTMTFDKRPQKAAGRGKGVGRVLMGTREVQI